MFYCLLRTEQQNRAHPRLFYLLKIFRLGFTRESISVIADNSFKKQKKNISTCDSVTCGIQLLEIIFNLQVVYQDSHYSQQIPDLKLD